MPFRQRMPDGGQLMGGTLTIRHGLFLIVASTVPLGVRGTCGRGWVVAGTLLGPEGTAARSCFSVPAPVNSTRVGWGWWVVGRCLRTAQWTRASVAKFLRAHGGCLGTRNR